MPSEVKWAISFLAGAGLLWLGWRFYIVLVVLHVFVCLVLMGVILLQSGEAADLAGAFGGSGSQTAFGPRGASNFLVASHDVVRGHVHVHLDGLGGARQDHGRRGSGPVDSRAVLETGAQVGSSGADKPVTDSTAVRAGTCAARTGTREIAPRIT